MYSRTSAIFPSRTVKMPAHRFSYGSPAAVGARGPLQGDGLPAENPGHCDAPLALARVDQDQLVAQVVGADRLLRSERVARMREHALRLARQDLPGRHAAHDRRIQGAVGDPREDRRRRQHLRLDDQLREPLGQHRKQLRRGLVCGARSIGQPDRADLSGGEPPHVPPQGIRIAQQRNAAREQQRARLGRLDVVRRSPQQLDAELILQ
jgi:hypothetical protein